jgi:streptogramin lyase
MSDLRHIRSIVLVTLMMIILGGCSGGSTGSSASSPATPSGESTGQAIQSPLLASPGATLQGRVVYRTAMLIPPSAREGVLADRAVIEQSGHTLNEDGSIVSWPDVAADGWTVSYDGATYLTSADGSFQIPRGTSFTGTVTHPSDASLSQTFTLADLSPGGQAVAPIVVLVGFGGPCHMNGTHGDECHQFDPVTARKTRKSASDESPVGGADDPHPLVCAALGSYASQDTSKCEISNGSGIGGALSNLDQKYDYFHYYWNSTCDLRVREGLCPNENRVSDSERLLRLASSGSSLVIAVLDFLNSDRSDPGGPSIHTIHCYANHRGRDCQELVPGDLSVLAASRIVVATDAFGNIPGPAAAPQASCPTAGEKGPAVVEVHAGDRVSILVHNNGNWGETSVDRDAARTLKGGFKTESFIKRVAIDGSQLQIQHYDADALAAWNKRSEAADQGPDSSIYKTDRALTYIVPSSAEEGQIDGYTLHCDGVFLHLLFKVVALPTPPSPDSTPTPTPTPAPTPVALSISPPNPSAAVGGSIAFLAIGGTPPYTWALSANPSGATIDPSTGVYVAGNTPNAVDVVELTDHDGASASVNVRVNPPSGFVTEFVAPTPPGASHAAPGEITVGPDGALWFTDEGWPAITRMTTAGQTSVFSVPTQNSLEGIVTGPDGNLWFTAVFDNQVGKMTPSGTVTLYNVPVQGPFGPSPYQIIAASDGKLWFTGNTDDYVYHTNPTWTLGEIFSVTPDGTVTEYPLMPTNPTAFNALGLTEGPDGNIWWVDHGSGLVGYVAPNGDVTAYALAGNLPRPVFITVGPDLNLWFTEYGGGSNLPQIGRITPAGVITEFPLSPSAGPQGITAGPDGNIWFTETQGIGRITPDGTITEFPLPNPNAYPYFIITGPDGNLWFTENYVVNGNGAGGGVGRITP